MVKKKHEPKRPKVFSLGGEGWDYLVLRYLQCLPPCSQYHHNFIPYALPKVFPFSPIYLGQSEGIAFPT
jgi:hypothetical protein